MTSCSLQKPPWAFRSNIGIAFVEWLLLLALAERRWIRERRWKTLRTMWADPILREARDLPDDERQRRDHEFGNRRREVAKTVKRGVKIEEMLLGSDSLDSRTALRLKALDTLPSALIAESFGWNSFTNEVHRPEILRLEREQHECVETSSVGP